MLIGLVACLGVALLTGTFFVPIRSCPPTDGFTTQLCMCLGGYLLSFLIFAFLHFPGLHHLPMIGGAIWAAANSFAVPVMSQVGMSMFMLFASSISCLTGWAISRFGLFGAPVAEPSSSFLNYAGIALLISGSLIYPFIKIHVSQPAKTEISNDAVLSMEAPIEESSRKAEEKSDRLKRVAAWIGTIITGLSLGVMTTPVTLLVTRPETHSVPFPVESPVAFHFSFFTGVLVTSIIVFSIYCIALRGNPVVPPRIMLPSMLSGALFSSSIALFFIANARLSPTISYPICMTAPGLVTSAWSVLYFKEIQGRRNLMLLAFAYVLTLVGVLVITASRAITL